MTTFTEKAIIIPSIESDIFFDRPEAQLWLGVVAVGPNILYPAEYAGSGILRANVYIDEKGYLPLDKRLSNGTEQDIDDLRSTHIVALENMKPGIVNVIGTTRLIHKSSKNEFLPVEELFSEKFPKPLAKNSSEVSRFISRHNQKTIRSLTSLLLIKSLITEAQKSNSSDVYGIVESYFPKILSSIGIPFFINIYIGPQDT